MSQEKEIATPEQLYRKVMKGKRTTYEPYTPPVLSAALNDDMSVREIISAVGSLAVLAINGYYEMLPEKSYVSNRVKAVRDAVLKLYKDTGAKIDDDTINHVTTTWNQTMWALSGKSPLIDAVQLQKGGSAEA